MNSEEVLVLIRDQQELGAALLNSCVCRMNGQLVPHEIKSEAFAVFHVLDCSLNNLARVLNAIFQEGGVNLIAEQCTIGRTNRLHIVSHGK